MLEVSGLFNVPAVLTPTETAPGTPRSGLYDMQEWKFMTLPGLEHDFSVVHPVSSRFSDWATAAPQISLARLV
jgi:hypothetical protein